MSVSQFSQLSLLRPLDGSAQLCQRRLQADRALVVALPAPLHDLGEGTTIASPFYDGAEGVGRVFFLGVGGRVHSNSHPTGFVLLGIELVLVLPVHEGEVRRGSVDHPPVAGGMARIAGLGAEQSDDLGVHVGEPLKEVPHRVGDVPAHGEEGRLDQARCWGRSRRGYAQRGSSLQMRASSQDEHENEPQDPFHHYLHRVWSANYRQAITSYKKEKVNTLDI